MAIITCQALFPGWRVSPSAVRVRLDVDGNVVIHRPMHACQSISTRHATTHNFIRCNFADCDADSAWQRERRKNSSLLLSPFSPPHWPWRPARGQNNGNGHVRRNASETSAWLLDGLLPQHTSHWPGLRALVACLGAMFLAVARQMFSWYIRRMGAIIFASLIWSPYRVWLTYSCCSFSRFYSPRLLFLSSSLYLL